jgi:uncharacterized membrane protein YtjA (UPF0391 family)
MIGWMMTFLVGTIIAALFGFTGLSTGEAGFARVLFFVLLAFLGVIVVAWLTTGRRHRA